MEFKEYSFRSLLSEIIDNRGKTVPTAEEGIPLIATNCIKNETLYPSYDKARYVSENTYKTWFRGHPKPGDMVFTCKGSPGRVCWVPDPIDFCIAQDMVGIRANEKIVYPKYLFALLRSEETQNKILNMHVGSLIPHFKKGDFGNLYFDIPLDMEYQRKVGDTYFDFCLKIESNRKTNQTLEQIAQALFKNWFVDFEPTRAKIAAKEAGASPEEIERAAMCAISGKTPDQLAQLPPETQQNLKTTAALFPDALVDSELGEMPEGWSVGKIGDIAAAKGGYAFKSNAFIPTGNPVVKIKNIVGDGRVDLIDTDCIDELESKRAERFKLNNGDLIMAMTGATVGKTGLVVPNGLSVYLNQRVAKFESELFGSKISWFLFCCFQRDVIFDLVVGAAHGSAQPNISSAGIESAQLILPGEKLIRFFCETTNSFFEKWMANISENNVTENLRNELLPKLLSGELGLINDDSIDDSD